MSTAIAPIGAGHNYETKQSCSSQLAGCNPARFLLAGRSGAGKGVALQNLLLNKALFRGCYARIHVFSPTVFLDDSTWAPVRKYIVEVLKHDEKKEGPFFHDSWDEGVVRKIIAEQQKMVDAQKTKGKKVHGIAICIDDYADRPDVTKRPDNVLTSLFLSGRHRFISTFILTQRLRAIATSIRNNATGICIWRATQYEYQAIEEEFSMIDKHTFRAIYEACTSEPYSFLFVRPSAPSLDETFMLRFERPIRFGEPEAEEATSLE